MPEIKPKSTADRGEHILDGMHPDLEGNLTLEPENLIKNGDMVELDSDGNPVGGQLEIGQVETPDGRVVLAGVTPSSATVQNTSPLNYDRQTYVQDGPLIQGAPPASPQTAALLPRPEKPTVRLIPAERYGYPQTTPERPLWCSIGWEVSGRHTMPGPAVPFQLAQGNGARVILPQDIPLGVTGIDIYLSEPGVATDVYEGTMYRQRTVPVRLYRGSTYDLTGPFRRENAAPTRNGTMLGQPDSPTVGRGYALNSVKGYYQVAIQGRTAFGTTPVGKLSSLYYISGNSNALVVTPRNVPSTWTGYRVFVVTGNRWYIAVDHIYGGADTFRPTTGPYGSMTVGGSKGDEQGGTDANGNELPPPTPSRYTIADSDVVIEDTSGLPGPESAPDPPYGFGRSVPTGPLSFRIADTLRGQMSIASESVTVNVPLGMIAEVQLPQATNRIANANYTDVAATGLPAAHEVTTNSNVAASVTLDGLVLETTSALTSTTEVTSPAPVEVTPAQDASYDVYFSIEDPPGGTRQGSFRTVIQQLNAAGVVISTTTIGEVGTPGNYVHSISVVRTGSTPGTGQISYASSSVRYMKVVVYFVTNSGSVSIKVTITGHRFLNFLHRWRLKPTPRPPVFTPPGPPPWKPKPKPPKPPAGGVTIIEPPFPPVIPGEYLTVPDPDRMRMSGTTILSEGYESASLPSGWTSVVGTGASLATTTTSPIDGARSLRALKSANTGSPTHAYMHRNAGFPNSKFAGFDTSFIPRGATPAGQLEFHEIRRGDGQRLAWLRMNSGAEVKKVSFSVPPTDSGHVKIGLEGSITNVPVLSDDHSEAVDVVAGSSASGALIINLNGTEHSIPVTGRREIQKLVVTDGQSGTSDNISLSLNGVKTRPPDDIPLGDVNTVASWIRGKFWPGWTTSGTGNEVIFTADSNGVRNGGYAFFKEDSDTTAYFVQVQAGSNSMSATQVADAIRSRDYAGWYITGSGTRVIFTAGTSGTRSLITWYNQGATGVSLTTTILKRGAQDTVNDIAARVRATAFSGWTLSGTGAEVFFTATTVGKKAQGTLDTQGTGVVGTISTPTPGGAGDVSVCFRDEAGSTEYRKVISNISSTTKTNVALVVNGAGTSNASIYAWGSAGTDPLRLLAYWNDIDLTSWPAVHVAEGVTTESTGAMTWDMYFDSTKITDRGTTWFREHNIDGEPLTQLSGFYLPTQPVRQDLLIKSLRLPVLPERSYKFGVVARFENMPSDIKAMPFYAEAILMDGSITPLGDLIFPTGVSGTLSWAEYTSNPIDIPDNCYEIRIHSRDVSSGTIIMQEFVFSAGSAVKRTKKYTTAGSFLATFNKHAAVRPGDIQVERRRISMQTRVEVPTECTSTILYRSADNIYGPWDQDDFYTTPNDVPDKVFLQVKGTFTGDGYKTVFVPSGSPSIEYMLMVAGKPVPTLLRADRTELRGGIHLLNVHEWSNRPKVSVSPQFSGRVRRQKIAAPVGYQQPCDVQCFSPEAKKWLEEEWGPPDPVMIEALGWLLEVKITAQPNLDRQVGTRRTLPDGSIFAVYNGKLEYMEIMDARPFES